MGTSVLETGEGIGTAFLIETDQPKEKAAGLESVRGRGRQ